MKSSILAAVAALALAAQDPSSAPVGVASRMRDVVLPGSELEAAPSDVTTPVVVRIADVRPHGDAHRYDLVWYGLDPGTYDLADFLRRVDGSSADDLPALPVEVRSVLPAGQVKPNRLAGAELPDPGGYATTATVLGVAWAAGLVAIVLVGRRRRLAAVAVPRRERTLAERLRPLVEDALKGELPAERRAELELALIALWRRRLGLAQSDAASALRTLKRHEEAGPLLVRLEEWLHRPPSDGAQAVDVAALLEPYRRLPADALDLPVAAAGNGSA